MYVMKRGAWHPRGLTMLAKANAPSSVVRPGAMTPRLDWRGKKPLRGRATLSRAFIHRCMKFVCVVHLPLARPSPVLLAQQAAAAEFVRLPVRRRFALRRNATAARNRGIVKQSVGRFPI